MSELKDWLIIRSSIDNFYLYGCIYNDSRFVDKTMIKTTRIINITNNDEDFVFETKNTKYSCKFIECKDIDLVNIILERSIV